ncbi:EXD2 [Symbiodinium natans]|uniref:EXD2 protein n=1 Tax=Symbiodinium natans TaxID=878477 RepID=A0A812N6M2_9DINO|nr:EXD2 [Symbiodinium natans]
MSQDVEWSLGAQLISPQRRVQRLFVEEFKKTMFSPNPWYECPEETFPGGTKRIYDYWMTNRPTRDIERIDDGRDGCGCAWKQDLAAMVASLYGVCHALPLPK